jgi:D-serine deaminase-like pyridoxal phosphate-dependent protein
MREHHASSVNAAAAGAITTFCGTPTNNQAAVSNGFMQLARNNSAKKSYMKNGGADSHQVSSLNVHKALVNRNLHHN